MKKKDLIKLLEAVSDDMEILVDGYEGGYDDIGEELLVKRVRRLEVRPAYCGIYDDDPNGFEAVIL